MINYQKKLYGNGLILLTAPLEDTEAVTVLVAVKVGSRYETKDINGISHFLEHLFFKGTKKRPSTLKLSKELDAMGAKYNAFTGEEITGFYIQSSKRHFKKAWDILSDMLLNPLIPPKEVERERGVILEEMNMYYDTPQIYVQELAKRAVYGDTPLGRDIVGTRETINSVTREQIANYRDKYYVPKNMIVVIAGSKTEDWEKLITQKLGAHTAGQQSQFEPVNLKLPIEPVNIAKKDTDQTHLVVNIKTFPSTDDRWPVLEVLANLLGGQMSSRLFIKIRERRGLAYYVRATAQSFHDTGLLNISAGLKTSNVKEALRVTATELHNLRTKPVTKEELKRSIDNIIGHMALSLEGSFSVAEFLMEQWFNERKIRQPEELIERYRAVTAKDILKLAQEIITNDNIITTMIGPIEPKTKSAFLKSISSKLK
jgi:predicted Zn-dependent peptidase